MADDLKIGRQIKALREKKGLSLRALARKTGIAVSFLSALENEQNNVSVAKLKSIIDALGTNLSAFFGQSPEPRAKVVYRKNELLEISGQGNGISFLEVATGRPDRALQFLVERYKPGADTGPELYRHEAEEAGVVLKGVLELTVDDEVFELSPGDTYYFDSRRPHRFRNRGRTTVEAISVNTPPSF